MRRQALSRAQMQSRQERKNQYNRPDNILKN